VAPSPLCCTPGSRWPTVTTTLRATSPRDRGDAQDTRPPRPFARRQIGFLWTRHRRFSDGTGCPSRTSTTCGISPPASGLDCRVRTAILHGTMTTIVALAAKSFIDRGRRASRPRAGLGPPWCCTRCSTTRWCPPGRGDAHGRPCGAGGLPERAHDARLGRRGSTSTSASSSSAPARSATRLDAT
jgi:hypothetical protein